MGLKQPLQQLLEQLAAQWHTFDVFISTVGQLLDSQAIEHVWQQMQAYVSQQELADVG